MPRTPVTLLIALATALAGCGPDNDHDKARSGGGGTNTRYAAAPELSTAPADAAARGNTFRFSGAPEFAANTRELQKKVQTGEAYVYDHNMTVSMASDFIRLRFERARDKCQNDPVLKCRIISASFQVLGEPDAPLPVANLTVALPHEYVTVFEQSLIAPLSNENKGDVFVKARTTRAENVTSQAQDLDGRLAQLTNYRDRMIELSKRGGNMEDLIKVEAEISQTQAAIEQIQAQVRNLAERVAKENLTISFEAQSTVSDTLQPLRDVWQNSLRVMAASGIAALALIVGIIPWIPVFLLAFFGLRWMIRRWRRAS